MLEVKPAIPESGLTIGEAARRSGGSPHTLRYYERAGRGSQDRLMRVEFARRAGGGSLATIERPDGIRLLLTSYDRTNSVPHDLAHFVTERDLGLQRGLWGSIASGALFDSLQILAGK